MKYMGSKRLMLLNGLGHVLKDELRDVNRFVDLFAGSGAVATHVAENYNVEVNAYDLQLYSTVLSNAIISREKEIEWVPIWEEWLKQAKIIIKNYRTPSTKKITQLVVINCRDWCAKKDDLPITKSYGGHYFSPKQAVVIDALRKTLPTNQEIRTVALASLIQAASKCAAAPGHTAQPFQPTRTAKKYLTEAWQKDIIDLTKNEFSLISKRAAYKKGIAKVANANEAVNDLTFGELVFIDPPYSGVHYSRFYHVLETIAQGDCGEVTGIGRYPKAILRPRSNYSMRSQSKMALDELLHKISSRGAKAILTFPDHECSNGLSGKIVRETASKYFKMEEHTVKSKFSTLGGRSNGEKSQAGRDARQYANELILVLKPK